MYIVRVQVLLLLPGEGGENRCLHEMKYFYQALRFGLSAYSQTESRKGKKSTKSPELHLLQRLSSFGVLLCPSPLSHFPFSSTRQEYSRIESESKRWGELLG